MPVAVNRGDRTLLLWGAGVMAVMVVIALLLGSNADRSETPTTFSAGSLGAKAAYLLLADAGYDEIRWERPLFGLPNPAETTLVLADPAGIPTSTDVGAIVQFVSAGGTVIATGENGARYLQGGADPNPIDALTWTATDAIAPSPITRQAATITLARASAWDDTLLALPLYGDADAPSVVTYERGRGRVYWWASATPLTNAGLRERGNLEFFLASIRPAHGRRVIWDEYIHGYRDSLAGSMAATPVKWVLAQFALLGAIVIVTYARRSGPIIMPRLESRLSPLEFVRTLGSLYRRAGATSTALDASYQRFRRLLTRGYGISARLPVDDAVAIVRARTGRDTAALHETLRACDVARVDFDLRPERALALAQQLDDHARQLHLVRT